MFLRGFIKYKLFNGTDDNRKDKSVVEQGNERAKNSGRSACSN
jgi:hypothetical protein